MESKIVIRLLEDHLVNNHNGVINYRFEKEADDLINQVKNIMESCLQGNDYIHYCLNLDSEYDSFIDTKDISIR